MVHKADRGAEANLKPDPPRHIDAVWEEKDVDLGVWLAAALVLGVGGRVGLPHVDDVVKDFRVPAI